MDGPGDYYTKSDKERQILYDTTFMRNLKKKKNGTLNLLLQQKQTHRLKRMNLQLKGKGGQIGIKIDNQQELTV